MFRVFSAFFLACITAVPIGIAMGMSPVARGIFDPPIEEFYRPLPPLACLPLIIIIIWYGIDEMPKVLLIYLACFAPLALATRLGMKSATREQINAACSMPANYRQLMLHVVLPSASKDSGGHAYCRRFWRNHAGRREDGGRPRWARADGAQRLELPAHLHRPHGNHRDRCAGLRVRPADALDWRCLVPWKGRMKAGGLRRLCDHWDQRNARA